MYQNIYQTQDQAIMSDKHRKICLKGSLVVLFMLLLQVSFGQDFSQADQFLVKNQKALGNELVVVVQKGGQPVYKKELGKDFTLQSTAKAEELTQWFVVATALLLNDEGKMKLDDPLAKFTPKYEQYMKGYITVRHALTHTHGLDAGKDNVGKIFSKNSFDNLNQENDVYITKRDIRSNPGEMFEYSRMGLGMAGKAMEAATKKSIDRLILEKLFRPLGLRQWQGGSLCRCFYIRSGLFKLLTDAFEQGNLEWKKDSERRRGARTAQATIYGCSCSDQARYV
jgi:hypothetical protein